MFDRGRRTDIAGESSYGEDSIWNCPQRETNSYIFCSKEAEQAAGQRRSRKIVRLLSERFIELFARIFPLTAMRVPFIGYIARKRRLIANRVRVAAYSRASSLGEGALRVAFSSATRYGIIPLSTMPERTRRRVMTRSIQLIKTRHSPLNFRRERPVEGL